MTSRRARLLDAAIQVIGERGIHGLTHRSLDAEAGLAAGSSSNHFRTRDALIDAVVERFAARERTLWDELAASTMPTTPGELAVLLSDYAKDATGPHRTLTMARYAILVEAGIHPALRGQLAATGARVSAWATNWVRVAGSPDPSRDAPLIMNYVTGLVLHQLAIPDAAFDPYPRIEALVFALVRPRAAATTA